MEDGKVILKGGGTGKRPALGRDNGQMKPDRESVNKPDREYVNKPDRECVNKPDKESVNMLVSGILHHEGRTFVRVSFLRGKDWAEGIVPDAVIEKAEGFSGEEIGLMEAYLAGEKETIIRQAKGINPIRNLFQL